MRKDEMKFSRIIQQAAVLKGVGFFMVILIVTHFAWKFTVKGDDADVQVSWLGMDVSAPFIAAADQVTTAVVSLLGIFGDQPERLADNILKFDSGHRLRIVWSCTGIKQGVIFMVIMLLYPGPWKHKAWYIPMGLGFVWMFNILRITLIAAAYGHNPASFELLHEHVFKYIFYGMLFLLWVIWEEKLATRKKDKLK